MLTETKINTNIEKQNTDVCPNAETSTCKPANNNRTNEQNPTLSQCPGGLVLGTHLLDHPDRHLNSNLVT